MPLGPNPTGDRPQVDPATWVHPGAVLIGKVRIASGVSIGPQAVLRADETGPDGTVAPIAVCAGANTIQDGVVIHALSGTSVMIGARSSVVHGPCETGTGCFIGFNTVVFNATLAHGVVVMHLALVEGVTVPGGLYVPSMTAVRCEEDARRLTPVTPEVAAFVQRARITNMQFAEPYAVL